jgi:hypothetical protein
VHGRSMLVSALMVAVVGLSGCAGTDDAPDDSSTETSTGTPTSPTGSATSEPTDAGQVIDITIKGDTVNPNGKKVDVKANEPVTLNVTADQPGEIHIHSTPEQEIEYAAGESTHTVTFDRPGVVEVESHSLEKVIVQLQVR